MVRQEAGEEEQAKANPDCSSGSRCSRPALDGPATAYDDAARLTTDDDAARPTTDDAAARPANDDAAARPAHDATTAHDATAAHDATTCSRTASNGPINSSSVRNVSVNRD